jgi:hypothetical protein
MEIHIKFDPYSAADRDRVHRFLDTLPTAGAKPPKEDDETEAAMDIFNKHGGEVQHHVIRDAMKAKGYRGWQTARRRLTKAGKIKKVAYGRYRLVKPEEAA